MNDDEIPFSPAPHPDLSHENAQVRPGTTNPYRPEYDIHPVEIESLGRLLVKVEQLFRTATHPYGDPAWRVYKQFLITWKHDLEQCIENGHRGPDGIFPAQLRDVCRYLGPVDGVSEVLRRENVNRVNKDSVQAQPRRPATRGLEEVIAATKEIQKYPGGHGAWPILKAELEEWEAQLEANSKQYMPESDHNIIRHNLAIVRSLLGRSEPEPAGARITEGVYRQMIDAIEDAYNTSVDAPMYPDGPCLPAAIRDSLREALTAARAELGEEKS